MYNHSKGEWKPKKIYLNDSCHIYTIWIQDNLTLNLKTNKPPTQLIPPIFFPDINKEDFVTAENELEANIVLMANAKVLLDACKYAFALLHQDQNNQQFIIENLRKAIKQATTIKFK